MEADQDRDGKISFDEFTKMVENTDVSMSMTLGKLFLASCHISNRQNLAMCEILPAAFQLGALEPSSSMTE